MPGLKQLFSLRLWLGTGHLDETAFKILIILTTFGFLAALVLKIAAAKHIRDDVYVLRLMRKISSLFFGVSLISYVLIFSGWQGAPFLSYRFLYLILALFSLIWTGIIVRYWYKKVPASKERIRTQKEFEKYLPKKKK